MNDFTIARCEWGPGDVPQKGYERPFAVPSAEDLKRDELLREADEARRQQRRPWRVRCRNAIDRILRGSRDQDPPTRE